MNSASVFLRTGNGRKKKINPCCFYWSLFFFLCFTAWYLAGHWWWFKDIHICYISMCWNLPIALTGASPLGSGALFEILLKIIFLLNHYKKTHNLVFSLLTQIYRGLDSKPNLWFKYMFIELCSLAIKSWTLTTNYIHWRYISRTTAPFSSSEPYRIARISFST